MKILLIFLKERRDTYAVKKYSSKFESNSQFPIKFLLFVFIFAASNDQKEDIQIVNQNVKLIIKKVQALGKFIQNPGNISINFLSKEIFKIKNIFSVFPLFSINKTSEFSETKIVVLTFGNSDHNL